MPKRDALQRDRCRHLVLGSQQVSEGQLAKVLERVAENPALLEDLVGQHPYSSSSHLPYGGPGSIYRDEDVYSDDEDDVEMDSEEDSEELYPDYSSRLEID